MMMEEEAQMIWIPEREKEKGKANEGVTVTAEADLRRCLGLPGTEWKTGDGKR